MSSRHQTFSLTLKLGADIALPEGWMPVFDESPTTPWSEKIYTRTLTHQGKTLHLIGL